MTSALHWTIICAVVLLHSTGLSASTQVEQTPPATIEQSQGLDAATTDPAQYEPYPAPDAGYVTDLANLLSLEQEDELERWLWEVERETTIEIAVLTIRSIRDSPDTNAATIEDFARGVFDAWGVGNMPDNRGVLLVVSVDDRKARIELGAGYGNLRDSDAAKIMDATIIPQFKKEDYAAGIRSGVKDLMHEFADVRIGLNWPLIFLTVLVPILIAIAISLFRSGKRGWGWVCLGAIAVALMAIFSSIQVAARNSADSGWGGSSGGFGGGFGGGFSGGGGATGSW